MGDAEAEFVSFAFLDPAADAMRPVVFFFPGGPGASVSEMIIGGLGAEIVAFPPPPARIADPTLHANAHDLTQVADLVFVDMPDVGFSRIVRGGESAFFGVLPDAEAHARFVLAWLTAAGKLNAPVFIAGLSYGTIRAAAAAERLLALAPELNLAGLISLCGVWDVQAIDFEPDSIARGNFTPFWSALPTYAAIAHFHGLADRGQSLDAVVARARRFALEEYAPALLNGARQTPARQRRLADRIAAMTGLPEATILEQNLRIDPNLFRTSVRPGQTLWIDNGAFAFDAEDLSPGTDILSEAWARALLSFGVNNGSDYRPSSLEPAGRWNWDMNAWGIGYPGAGQAVAAIMRQRPHARLFVAMGYFDLLTPFALIENATANFTLPQDRISRRHYASGHTLWVDPRAGRQLSLDLASWLADQSGAPS